MIRAGLAAVIEDPAEAVEVQRRAVESIAFINDDIVRRIIDRAYAHDSANMRQSALFAMGRNADRFWTETVLAELYSDAPGMRIEAARAAGEMGLRRAVEQLIQLAEDADRDVQRMAIWALGQIGGKRARTILEQYAESEDEELVELADEALQEIEFGSGAMYMMVHDPAEQSDLDDLIDDQVDEDEDDEEDDEAADEAAWREDFLALD
jgi:HEAT repeat protein